MMEKRMHGKIEKTIKNSETEQDAFGDTSFPLGTKFSLNNRIWRVTIAFNETNTEMRHLQNDSGEEEVVTLRTLQKDISDPTFSFVELTDNEKLRLKAQKTANKKK